jgi:hypothetical protein
MTYIITIENDMKQQLVFHAESIVEALDKAKKAFKESMVTAIDDNGEFRQKPLSTKPKIVHLSPQQPTARDTKPDTKEEQKNSYINVPR